ncbi:MAG: hypothetical protein EXR75_14945 [Myxococcales bacterium]|nr:hypothetical protein [Myxococcales bacterium]
MNGERKNGSPHLELLTGGLGAHDAGAARAKFDAAGDTEDRALGAALRAVAGAELDDTDHEALLSLALGSDGVELVLSAEERALATSLARALERGEAHPMATLASSLRAACGSGVVDALANERLIRRALRGVGVADTGIGLRAVLGTLAALAAAVALVVSGLPDGSKPMQAKGARVHEGSARDGHVHDGLVLPPRAVLIAPRTTAALFDPSEPFPAKGGESERMGRIVAARAADLRANRFAAWGVR